MGIGASLQMVKLPAGSNSSKRAGQGRAGRGLNPLIAILKLQSNGPSYSNTVIGTLDVDGLAVTFGTARRRLGGAVLNVTAHPPVYQLSIIRCGTIIAFGI